MLRTRRCRSPPLLTQSPTAASAHCALVLAAVEWRKDTACDVVQHRDALADARTSRSTGERGAVQAVAQCMHGGQCHVHTPQQRNAA